MPFSLFKIPRSAPPPWVREILLAPCSDLYSDPHNLQLGREDPVFVSRSAFSSIKGGNFKSPCSHTILLQTRPISRGFSIRCLRRHRRRRCYRRRRRCFRVPDCETRLIIWSGLHCRCHRSRRCANCLLVHEYCCSCGVAGAVAGAAAAVVVVDGGNTEVIVVAVGVWEE